VLEVAAGSEAVENKLLVIFGN